MINKKIKKLVWSDEADRFLLDNSKLMNLDKLALAVNRKESAVRKRCTIIGCGYTNKL